MSLLKVNPMKNYKGYFRVPSSKPETQRAILVAAMAEGISYVHNDLRCSETNTMKNACRNFGAGIIEHDTFLEIRGVGGKPQYTRNVIDCKGSGLVFRIFSALASIVNEPVVLTGDDTLCDRVMLPLFKALEQFDVRIESILKKGKVPIVNWSNRLLGGKCVLPGNISSQFITAVLLVAPFAEDIVEIFIDGEVYSQSYIRQTVECMISSGVDVDFSSDFKYFKVQPGVYQAGNFYIKEDYTSASYILACASLFPGKTVLSNVHGDSLQGEQAILKIIKSLGVDVQFNQDSHEVVIENSLDELRGDFEFSAVDYPNIVPTLAALGSFINGRFRVVGASITRFHKASRVEAIVSELQKLGVDIQLIKKEGICDGFEIRGKSSYAGGEILSSWGDHRIFMSLFIASLRMKMPCFLSGYEDVDCSFPSFLSDFKNAGVELESVSEVCV